MRQKTDFNAAGQNRGIAPLPIENPAPEGIQLIDLLPAEKLQGTSVMD